MRAGIHAARGNQDTWRFGTRGLYSPCRLCASACLPVGERYLALFAKYKKIPLAKVMLIVYVAITVPGRSAWAEMSWQTHPGVVKLLCLPSNFPGVTGCSQHLPQTLLNAGTKQCSSLQPWHLTALGGCAIHSGLPRYHPLLPAAQFRAVKVFRSWQQELGGQVPFAFPLRGTFSAV